MTRETKIGVLLVLVLAGVFGFLVYKKTIRPGEVVAQTEESTSGGEPTDDGTLSETDADDDTPSFGDPDSESPLMTVSKPTRPIPADDELESDAELNDPFNSASNAAPRTPATSKPRLPTMIPDEKPKEEFETAASTTTIVEDDGSDLESNDPFASEEDETTISDSDSFSAVDDRRPLASSSVNAAPADKDEEEFAEPLSLDAPATTVSVPMESADEGPELSFEDAETTESEAFPAKEPASKAKLPTATLPPADEEPFLVDDEEAVSVQVRTKLPEAAVDFGETDEPQPLQPATELESKELSPESSPPELMLDDSEEDRYGGYEPIELTSAESEATFTDGDVNAAPRRVLEEAEPFAATSEDRSPPTISGNRYVIQPGDNFWSISQKKYGAGRYFQALAASNQSHVPDASRMKPGVEIALPTTEELEARYATLIPRQRTEEPAAAAGTGNVVGELLRGSDGEPLYRVGSGDTLSGIAQKYLGRSRRWEQILEMNRDILKDGNTLKMGAVLKLPADATDLQLSTQPRLFR